VPKDAAANRSPAAAVAAPAATAGANPMPPPVDVDPMAPVRNPAVATSRVAPSPAVPPAALSGGAPRPPQVHPGTAAPPAVEPPPAVVAPPTRRVAQFITADTAQSQLTLAADGKLPELHLSTDETGPRKKKSFAGGNSWGMVALVAGSLLMALVVLLIPGPGSNDGPSSQSADQNRIRLQKIYFGSEAVELRPYQVLLRRAQQAHDRGDRKAERQYYLEVMRMLRGENLHPLGRSLTGMITPANDPNLPNDQDLERTLSALLSER